MVELNVLALNAGSSSIKAGLYLFSSEEPPVDPVPPLWKFGASWDARPHQNVIDSLLDSLARRKIDVVGHRVVHGGSRFRESIRITADVKTAIAETASLAPAHSGIAIQMIDAVEHKLGADMPQVAVFDTAFHSTLPPAAYVYPGPYSWISGNIRRYGFHGISHQYASARAARMLGRDAASLRIITCHLGSGCSLAAVRNGVCVDTTMGFTPLEGLMMGTRSGSIDPGLVLHLLRRGDSVDRVEEVLNRESGLLGISGISSDMREIRAAVERGEPRAKLAFDIYVHRIRFHIGAMVPALGGLDALVFTGGVGEHSAEVRDAVCWDLGLGAPEILVMEAQEEWQIALECLKLCQRASAK